ncbi:MAG: helicase, partial [Planctomyces sp.]
EERSDHDGKAQKVWKRYPQSGTLTIPLIAGPVAMRSPVPDFQDVQIQGQIRKRDTHYIVTLFLVNNQLERRPKDECHLFQPKLKVTGKDGQAIFCRRATVSNQDDPEERLTAMLYRHQIEFAVGHGVGVHAEVAGDSPSGARHSPPATHHANSTT